MKPGVLFLIAKDSIQAFVDVGVLKSDGTFVKPNPAQDAILIAKIIEIMKKYGVHTPSQLDAVVAMLPLIFQLAGLK